MTAALVMNESNFLMLICLIRMRVNLVAQRDSQKGWELSSVTLVLTAHRVAKICCQKSELIWF